MTDLPLVAVTCNQAVHDREHVGMLLAEAGYESRFTGSSQQLHGAELLHALRDCVGVIAGDETLGEEEISSLPSLRAISRWGVGIDNVDLNAAARHQVAVTNTPGVFADTVAEVGLGYLIALLRGLVVVDRAAQRGEWAKYRGRSLAESTVGVVGLGSIGRKLCEMLQPLVAGVSAFDEAADFGRQSCEVLGVDFRTADEVFASCDAVILTAALTEKTRHIADDRSIGLMPRNGLLINVGRGPLVSEPALIRALQSGALGGAALDVFEVEPLPPDSTLLGLENVVLGSHNASNSRAGCMRTHTQAVANLVKSLEGSLA